MVSLSTVCFETAVGGSKVFVYLVFPDAQPEGVGAPLLLGQVVWSQDAHVNSVEEIQLGATLIQMTPVMLTITLLRFPSFCCSKLTTLGVRIRVLIRLFILGPSSS